MGDFGAFVFAYAAVNLVVYTIVIIFFCKNMNKPKGQRNPWPSIFFILNTIWIVLNIIVVIGILALGYAIVATM